MKLTTFKYGIAYFSKSSQRTVNGSLRVGMGAVYGVMSIRFRGIRKPFVVGSVGRIMRKPSGTKR